MITNESLKIMKEAQNLILRTKIHPTVDGLVERGINFTSFDDYYENAKNFEDLYEKIAQELIDKAINGEDIVYAVPGSPLVAERTVVILREKAKSYDVNIEILPGMSFLEILYVSLGIDPIEGISIIDAEDIDNINLDNKLGIVLTQVYNKQIASNVKLALMDIFDDDYGIVYLHNLGLSDEKIVKIPLYELDRQDDIDHLTTVFIPRLNT